MQPVIFVKKEHNYNYNNNYARDHNTVKLLLVHVLCVHARDEILRIVIAIIIIRE